MKVSDFVFCDDIRHEVGGKVSLMGVLDPSIKLLSQMLTLGIYLVTELDEKEVPTNFTMRVSIGENTLTLVEGELPPKKGDRVRFAGKVEHIPITEPCELSVEFALFTKGTRIGEGTRSLRVTAVSADSSSLSVT